LQALLDEGLFCGLALDEDNEDDKTAGRVKAWVKQLKGEGF
jgi:flavodoxin I